MAVTSSVLVAGFGSAGLSLALTPLVGRVARAFGVVDVPNVRKVHRQPVARTGGLAIGVAALAAIVAAAVAFGGTDWARLVPLLIGAASVLVIGVIDDVCDLRSSYKLLALVAAALVFCATGGAVHEVIVSGRVLVHLGDAAWPLTILGIVTVTVSINFIDGLDGLAAGIVAAAGGVLAVGAGVGGDWPVALIGLALCGSLLAFLVYNYHPASIFMGDGGSMFIGFLLAAGCASANQHVGTVRAILLPAIALSIPLLDTALTMVRRGVLHRGSLFAAERGHVHHRLMDVGLGHRHAVLFLHGVTVGGAGLGLLCIFAGGVPAVAMGVVFCSGLAFLFRTAGSVRARDTIAAIRRNRAIGRENRRYLAAFYDLQLRFREARTIDGWWEQLCRAADVLDFAQVDVPMVRRDGSVTRLRWRRGPAGVADARSITAEVPIPQRRTDASMRAQVDEYLESGGQRLALFSRLMAEFGLDQLRRPAKPSAPSLASLMPRSIAAASASRSAQIAFEGRPDGGPAAGGGPFAGLRVAVVHDFLYTYAGAERVLEQIIRVCPHADLFSLFDFLPADQRGFIGGKPVRTSFLQRMPFAKTRHRSYLPLMPLAVEQLDVSAYDLVVSSSYVAAKGVITRPDQLHVSYCHTPVRFAWDLQGQYLTQSGMTTGFRSALVRMVLHYIRSWDLRSAQGVDVFLANSDFVGRRIRKLYRRESITVHPPVDTEAFALHTAKEDFYLTASRMVPYKRMDLVVEAFARMPTRRLLVVGDGPEMERVRAKASPNVTFLGHETADRLRRHMQLARAFVFAAEEDFGIAAVEAQACGTPVIAYGRGGATETVVDGQTGLFFPEQTAIAIVTAVERFETLAWDAAAIRRHAEQFSEQHFRDRFAAVVRREWVNFMAIGLQGNHLRQLGRVLADDGLETLDATSAAANPRIEPGDTVIGTGVS
jgi:UDP-N-acetylmuramyl pentapeptide phosphotransferase/UDP-N-acetylglucosamine-1-phosphate transferase/glycosyltransferase involved in cell wall biosynthesis